MPPQTGSIEISASTENVFSFRATDLGQLDNFKFYGTGTLGEGEERKSSSFSPHSPHLPTLTLPHTKKPQRNHNLLASLHLTLIFIEWERKTNSNSFLLISQ